MGTLTLEFLIVVLGVLIALAVDQAVALSRSFETRVYALGGTGPRSRRV